jgi:hypothetical protein
LVEVWEIVWASEKEKSLEQSSADMSAYLRDLHLVARMVALMALRMESRKAA